MIYINEFYVENVDDLKRLIQKYNVVDIAKTNWLNVRNEQALAFLRSFNQELPPTIIRHKSFLAFHWLQ